MKNTMNKGFLFLVLAVLVAAGAFAQNKASDFEFDAGTGTITKYTGTAKRVVFPARIDGKAVTAIGAGAFAGNQIIIEAVIPEGVTEIGDDAFNGTQIKSVTLPRSIKKIGSNAFRACGELTTVTIPSGVTSIIFGNSGPFSVAFGGTDLDNASRKALTDRGYKGLF
ncbi:MAG: leucine-rich repeat domain-containing protein [Treponema sp.]|nr:leucine-rich repeat domain-containing protein [Treponema sp.]